MLNIIRERGPITRREAAEASRLSLTTAKRFIEDLLQERLALEHGIERPAAPSDPAGSRRLASRRGRKAGELRLNPRCGHAIGASIEPGRLLLTVVDLGGNLLQERAIADPGRERAPIIARLLGDVRGAIAEFGGGDYGRLLGLGVGVAGVIDARQGIVLFCPNLPGWEDVPLAALLREELGCEVRVDDGVRCMALAEKRGGLGRDLETFLYLYIGRGVGAGILLDGRFYRGRNGLSGEFGHITIRESGPLCNCGNRGCLEALVSVDAILASVRGLLASNVYSSLRGKADEGPGLTLPDIGEAAEAGDKLANMVVHGVGESIGTGIADLVNIFDPGVVILGGEVIAHFGDHLIEGIVKTVHLRGIHSITRRTRIMAGRYEPAAAARGAATMVVESFFGSGILGL
jgi:predicted NBD/HSP70 family sugar kinase